jgi:LysM repeat protein
MARKSKNSGRRSGRRSGRNSKTGGLGKMLVGACLMIALGAGGFLAWQAHADSGTTQAGITDLIPTLNNDRKKPDQQAAKPEKAGDNAAAAQSLAQVQRLLTDVAANLAVTEGDTREKALRDGYKRLVTLLESPLPIEERARALEVFHAITDELFLSPVHNEFNNNYVVRSGDSYDRIARRHGISNNLLYDLNARPRGSTNLHPGQNLKVPTGQPRIVVRKADFTTSLYLGEHLVRQYIVAHGANNNTPEGDTVIASMTIDPEKTSRGPNDPVNEMKLRWIGLRDYANGRSGIGFHGTQYPESIPGMTSRGCIRMHDGDVIELYDIVRIGNQVEVRP